MSDYIFFLLLGTGAGAIIAGLGIGLVVTHHGTGVVNFAHGAMATWVVYVYADLREGAYPFPIPGLPARYHFGGSMADDVGFRWAMVLSLATAAVLGLVERFKVKTTTWINSIPMLPLVILSVSPV